MRIDGDGQAIYEVTVLLTPDEAQEVIRALEMLRDVVPSTKRITHTHVDDATDDEGGEREITLVVYADPDVERNHDENFASARRKR